MKAKINGIEVDLSVNEFKELTGIKAKQVRKPYKTRNKKQNSNKRWTAKDIRELWELHTKGGTIAYISSTIGRTKGAIKLMLWEIRTGRRKVNKGVIEK